MRLRGICRHHGATILTATSLFTGPRVQRGATHALRAAIVRDKARSSESRKDIGCSVCLLAFLPIHSGWFCFPSADRGGKIGVAGLASGFWTSRAQGLASSHAKLASVADMERECSVNEEIGTLS